MFKSRLKFTMACAAAILAAGVCAAADAVLTSPDSAGSIRVFLDDGNVLRVERKTANGSDSVFKVKLGIKSDRGEYDFSKLSLKSNAAAQPKLVSGRYTSVNGKRSDRSYRMNEKTLSFADSDGKKIGLTLRAGSNAFAFRYELDGAAGTPITFQGEQTAFIFPESDGIRVQRRVTSYEDFYRLYPAANMRSGNWNYPVLFNTADKSTWGLLTETGFDGTYCGTFLHTDANAKGVFTTMYPDKGEGAGTGEVNPVTVLPWKSPWRAAVIGGLADVVESTLADDLAPECAVQDVSWIQPGMAAWVYWAFNHGSKDFKIVKDYIDLAAEMKWPNVLIDWEWDVMGNGGNINDALAYAKQKGVGVWLWYNSGGKHNWVGGGPRDRFLTHELRDKEFSWLAGLGVKGVKVDFFESDKQSMMQYYLDLLKDSAAHKIMINFHGCTLPRGWSRTWPNLMSMEGVAGAEQYNNGPRMTEAGAEHNTTLPFTRNAVGPMDYTPTAFTDSQHAHTTSHAHELALPVIFESPAQHMADRPSSFRSLPAQVKDFLTTLPTAWDDTKYIDGIPGESVSIARRKGTVWYVSGINGTNSSRAFKFRVPGKTGETFSWLRICDGENRTSFDISEGTAKAGDEISGTMLGRGGFSFRFIKK